MDDSSCILCAFLYAIVLKNLLHEIELSPENASYCNLFDGFVCSRSFAVEMYWTSLLGAGVMKCVCYLLFDGHIGLITSKVNVPLLLPQNALFPQSDKR